MPSLRTIWLRNNGPHMFLLHKLTWLTSSFSWPFLRRKHAMLSSYAAHMTLLSRERKQEPIHLRSPKAR
jgi:hypothetical protein